jgi:cytochrome c5
MKSHIGMILLSFVSLLQAAEQDSIKRGKQIYDTVCFACHGKNLEGATGFNLKDAEWIHGDSPELIQATIEKGFPEKGMIPFATIYKKNQIKDVVNFILSRQEGLRNLKYEIYQGLKADKKIEEMSWATLKANKSGIIKPSYVDLNIPEVDNFAIMYKGDMLIPETGKYDLQGSMRQSSHVQILIDGKVLPLKIKGKHFKHNVELTQGTHNFELRYVKIHKYSNISLNLKKKGFDIPLSVNSFNAIKNQKILVGATTKPLIMRKRIDGLPTKTIAISYPEKVNIAINPLNASINAMWVGEFLDIAPNINGRGNRGSKALAPYLFNGESGVNLLVNGKTPVIDFIKYSTYKGPEFTFTANGKKVVIAAKAQGQSIELSYITELEHVSLKIPAGVKVSSNQGKIKDGILKISNSKKFSLVLAKEEK